VATKGRKAGQAIASRDGAALHERHRLCAELLAAGQTTQEIAAQLGCDEATVWRWRQRPDFCALVDASRARFVQTLRDELRRGSRQAIAALVEIASDPDAAPAARVSASTAILDRVGLPRRTEIEATVEGTTEIRVDLSGATLEQLAALAGAGDDDGEGGR
jgi:transposase-like protein